MGARPSIDITGATVRCSTKLSYAHQERRQLNTTQAERESKEFRAWHNMLSRCYRSTATGYANYGGRGITVCERWRASYAAFLDDMGRAPLKYLTLDRIDTNGNYENANCRWATRSQQNTNRRPWRVL